VGARLGGAIGPALAAVELGDEREPPMVGRVQVACKFGDSGADLVERQGARFSIGWACRLDTQTAVNQ
jgi:hypothetical protein